MQATQFEWTNCFVFLLCLATPSSQVYGGTIYLITNVYNVCFSSTPFVPGVL